MEGEGWLPLGLLTFQLTLTHREELLRMFFFVWYRAVHYLGAVGIQESERMRGTLGTKWLAGYAVI